MTRLALNSFAISTFVLTLLLPVYAHGEQVTVNVTVQTELGLPLQNVPLGIHAPTPMQLQFAFTNATGQASKAVDILEGADEISVFLYRGTRAGLSTEDLVLANERYKLYSEEYFFQHVYSIPVVPGQTLYSITITAYDAIQVVGRVINQPTWQDETCQIDVRGGVWMGKFKPGEQFTVRGVRKGAPAELFVDYTGNRVHSIILDAVQTQNNVDLGDIELPTVQGDATLNIVMQNAQSKWGPGGLHPLWWGVTVIRADGQLIFGYHRKADGQLVVGTDDGDQDPDALPQVPPGTYYLVPGTLVSKLQLNLLNALRAGNHAALDAHNVPKIVAVSGQTVSLTFDAIQARDAIMAATNNP